jgi:hypothetical protein
MAVCKVCTVTAIAFSVILAACVSSGLTDQPPRPIDNPTSLQDAAADPSNLHSALSHDISEAVIYVGWDREDSEFANVRKFLFEDGCSLQRVWVNPDDVHERIGKASADQVSVLLASADVMEFAEFPDQLRADGTYTPMPTIRINGKSVAFSRGLSTESLISLASMSPLQAVRLLQIAGLASRVGDAISYSRID